MNLYQPCNFCKGVSFSNGNHGFLTPLPQCLFQINKSRACILRFFSGRNPKRKSEANNNNTRGLFKESSVEEPLNQPIDPCTCYALHLQERSDIEAVEQVHGHMLRSGNDQIIFLVTKLINSYTMSGKMQNARRVFDKIRKRDSFLWNVMIRGYANNGLCEEAIALYYEMISAGVQPDKFTFPFVLKACAGLSDLQEGQKIYRHIANSELQSDLFVATALADMYFKCGRLDIAREVFDKISERNVVSWNVMINGYAQNGDAIAALALFTQMQLEGMKPDIVTMVGVLQACVYLAALKQGV